MQKWWSWCVDHDDNDNNDDNDDDIDDDDIDDDDDAQERGGEWSIEFLADDLAEGETEGGKVIIIIAITVITSSEKNSGV